MPLVVCLFLMEEDEPADPRRSMIEQTCVLGQRWSQGGCGRLRHIGLVRRQLATFERLIRKTGLALRGEAPSESIPAYFV